MPASWIAGSGWDGSRLAPMTAQTLAASPVRWYALRASVEIDVANALDRDLEHIEAERLRLIEEVQVLGLER